MKKYAHIKEYCEETGFPMEVMRKLCRSYLADRFSFRSSGAQKAPINIIIPVFESMLERGDFKEIIEE